MVAFGHPIVSGSTSMTASVNFISNVLACGDAILFAFSFQTFANDQCEQSHRQFQIFKCNGYRNGVPVATTSAVGCGIGEAV